MKGQAALWHSLTVSPESRVVLSLGNTGLSFFKYIFTGCEIMPNKLQKEQIHSGDTVFPVTDFVVVVFAKLVHLVLDWILIISPFSPKFILKMNSFLVFQKIIEG